MRAERWLLPEGVEEVLPPEAERLERLRRSVLDLYASWGYELVIPPFIEYLDSLLTGTGHDLDLETFNLIDQLTGRLMGVRADMTPQVARIDAHSLRRLEPARLCYVGTVLHTLPGGISGRRAPMQVGAELYGHAGIESDCEVVCLMLETLRAAHVTDVHLDVGHVGVFRGLAGAAGLDGEREDRLHGALQRKARPEIEELLRSADVSREVGRKIVALTELNGADEALDEARRVLGGADRMVTGALDATERLTEEIRARTPGASVHYDFAELRGYRYHTGIVFAAFIPGHGQEIARGGRYDEIGAVFGHARPATGFSTDLSLLAGLGQRSAACARSAILAPWSGDDELTALVRDLRARGERVLCALPGQVGDAQALGCDRVIVRSGESWAVRPSEGSSESPPGGPLERSP